jgi:retron-type reverse transcriptase
MTIAQFPAFARQHWETVRSRLIAGTYHPAPVRRVFIPKPTGDLRPLGIPTVLDRVIQQAIAQILTPLFDPHFSTHSYGFRYGKRAHQAVRSVEAAAGAGYLYAVDCDLKSFFDTVKFDRLMRLLACRISDKRVLRLIGAYLRAGVRLKDGQVEATTQGVPQGGPLTPRTQWITCKLSAPAGGPGRNRMVDRDQVFADGDLLDEQAQQLLSFNRSHCLSGLVQAAKKRFHRVAHFDPTLVFHSSHLQVLLLLLQRPEFLFDLRGSLS